MKIRRYDTEKIKILLVDICDTNTPNLGHLIFDQSGVSRLREATKQSN
jgi:hypothetical protein